jgi:hypothetical protein
MTAKTTPQRRDRDRTPTLSAAVVLERTDRTKTGPTPKRRDRARTSYSARACTACGRPSCGWTVRCTAAPAAPVRP